MAWKKYRKPDRQYDATTPDWKLNTSVVQVEEYTCPVCGAEANKQQSVIVRHVGYNDQIPYQVGAPVPSTLTGQRTSPGCRIIATKCRACGVILSGSQSLSTDMYVGKFK